MTTFVPVPDSAGTEYEFQMWWLAFQREIIMHTIAVANKLNGASDRGEIKIDGTIMRQCFILMPEGYEHLLLAEDIGAKIIRDSIGNRQHMGSELKFCFARTLQVCSAIIEVNRAYGMEYPKP